MQTYIKDSMQVFAFGQTGLHHKKDGEKLMETTTKKTNTEFFKTKHTTYLLSS
jgi:hypothetical protein